MAALDDQVREADPDRWLSSRFVADEALRADLIALYAFEAELLAIPTRVTQPLLAEISIISSEPGELEQLRARLASPTTFERVGLPMIENLRAIGVDATIRLVDSTQYEKRQTSFDFDMIQNRWDQSLSPGNEQAFYWGSEAADAQGSRNYMGAKDAVIDAMIAALLKAREHPDFVAAVRALDRALIAGAYAISVYNVGEQWIARWNRIERPKATALSGYLPETWWAKPEPR